MATHASARKRARQNVKRRVRNRSIKTGMRGFVAQVRALAAANKKDEAAKMLPAAMGEIDRACARGVIKPRQASRRIARLSRMLSKKG